MTGKHEHEPKITVSGNRMWVTRLDAEGNPAGEPIELSGKVNDLSIDLPVDGITDWDMLTDKTLTLEVSLMKVDPELIAMLTGQSPLPPRDHWFFLPSRWQRVVRFVKRWKWTITAAVMFALMTAASVWWLMFLWRRLFGE